MTHILPSTSDPMVKKPKEQEGGMMYVRYVTKSNKEKNNKNNQNHTRSRIKVIIDNLIIDNY